MFRLKSKTTWVWILLVGLYLLTHLYQLTNLPVFADESIYIRWSQLIIDDWRRYLFFPLNDGKTPLHMWLMTPLQLMWRDQLFAGRFLSVLVGLGQMFVTARIVKLLGGRKKAQWLSMVLVIILPFWFFHHRTALIDGLMTFWLSLSVFYTARMIIGSKNQQGKLDGLVKWFAKLIQKGTPSGMGDSILAGIFFGLALLSKLSALLFIPALVVLSLLKAKSTAPRWIKDLSRIMFSVVIGLGLFFTLKLHPAFGQLFNRGNDFVFSFSELRQTGLLGVMSFNTSQFWNVFLTYLSWPVLMLAIVSIFSKKHKRVHVVLLLAAISFLFPLVVVGKVVYARYLLPAAIFFTISASLVIQTIVERLAVRKILSQRVALSILLVLVLAQTVNVALAFSWNSWFDPNQLQLTPKDKVQYLYEWSSGHGIKETVALIQSLATNHSVIVATEGYFGTLPDGILMYLHRQDVTNLFVQGIGQPVRSLPAEFIEKAASFDQALLVVNSHRLKMSIQKSHLIEQYCRPDNAPCLQIWDITHLVKSTL